MSFGANFPLWQLSFFCCSLFGVVSNVGAERSRPTVRIGVVLPLSGGASHLGTAYRDAMLLAIEDRGTKTRFQYELLFEDDQGQLTNTASAAQKLLNVDKVDAITSLWSNQGRVVAPMAEKLGRIHLACAWDKGVTTSKTTFNVSATPDYFMPQYVRALERRNVNRLSIIELNDSGSIAAHDELLRQAKDSSVAIVRRQRFNNGDRDFRTMLALERSSASDVLYLNAGSPELEILAKQLRAMNIQRPLTTIGCFDFTTDLNLFEGSWYMTMTWPQQEFIDRYRARFGRDIVYQLGNFYDMIGLLIDGFEHGTTTDRPSPREALQHLLAVRKYSGVLGTLTVDEARAFQSPPTFFEINRGRRIRIDG